jgi:uncharacterized membrane protein YraQ (UPF0718 family)
MSKEVKGVLEKIIKETAVYVVIGLLIWGLIGVFSFSKAIIVAKVTYNVFAKMIGIIAAVFLLLGLVQVWIPPNKIAKYLGKEAGWKALFFASVFPMILGGPLFVMFPLLKILKDKGASTAVILAFLTSWSGKFPLLPLSAGFLGWKFTILRTIFIIPMALLIGVIGEALIEKKIKV